MASDNFFLALQEYSNFPHGTETKRNRKIRASQILDVFFFLSFPEMAERIWLLVRMCGISGVSLNWSLNMLHLCGCYRVFVGVIDTLVNYHLNLSWSPCVWGPFLVLFMLSYCWNCFEYVCVKLLFKLFWVHQCGARLYVLEKVGWSFLWK